MGLAWLNLTGIWPPSGNPGMLKVIAGGWAESIVVMKSAVEQRSHRMGLSYPVLARYFLASATGTRSIKAPTLWVGFIGPKFAWHSTQAGLKLLSGTERR